MRQDIPLLDNVRVAAPCPANWNEMVGGERVRYCRACEKNVYNLSEMSREDAENLLETHEGRLCIRYYQRADGKILTQNCPVGLRAARRLYIKANAKIAAALTAIFGVSVAVLFPTVHERTGAPTSLRGDIRIRELEVQEAKSDLDASGQPLTAGEREKLKEMIEHNRREIKEDLRILQKRAEKGRKLELTPDLFAKADVVF